MHKKHNEKTSEGGFELGIGGILKGFGDLVEKLGDLAKTGEQLSRTGEIHGAGKEVKGIYGFTVKVGLGDDGPRIEPRSGTAKQLVVFLHGYGADGNDQQEIDDKRLST